MAQHNELGKKGEDIAEDYLRNKGYEILHRNWSYKKNEVDIIALTFDTIVFIEVKTRSTNQWGNPEEAVSDQKIKRIVEAANHYMQENTELDFARFDIISIVLDKNSINIEHIEDAFYAPLN